MLDGLITFFASHHAIRADKVLAESGFEVKLIPGPKELSPNCGTALRFRYDEREAAEEVLTTSKVRVDEIIRYQPRTDTWGRGGRIRRLLGRS